MIGQSSCAIARENGTVPTRWGMIADKILVGFACNSSCSVCYQQSDLQSLNSLVVLEEACEDSQLIRFHSYKFIKHSYGLYIYRIYIPYIVKAVSYHIHVCLYLYEMHHKRTDFVDVWSVMAQISLCI